MLSLPLMERMAIGNELVDLVLDILLIVFRKAKCSSVGMIISFRSKTGVRLFLMDSLF